MDGQMDGWVVGWLDGWLDGYSSVQQDGSTMSEGAALWLVHRCGNIIFAIKYLTAKVQPTCGRSVSRQGAQDSEFLCIIFIICVLLYL